MKNAQDAISVIGRLAIGGILLYAGFTKAVGPHAEFTAAIMAYKIVPAMAANWIAQGLPWIEMWVGIYLLAGYFIRFFAGISALLFLIFMGVLGSSLARGIDIVSCGCFGNDFHIPPRYTILLDAFLLVLSFLLARYASSCWAIERWFEEKQ